MNIRKRRLKWVAFFVREMHPIFTTMNYEETLEYLFTKLPMYSRIGAAAYKADLENAIALCSSLDNPQHKIRTIHVAGTNGKGSVSHMLAAIFQEAGYKTGLYTSPHLKDFRERIRINGAMIEKDFIVDFTHRVEPMITKLDPSFFELTMAMAFDYFADRLVDIAIIETGLGGRLDSTNVIQPELSIITNIGWDHMNLLGDSLEKIATEKAGIIKEKTAVVIGEAKPGLREIFEKTAAQLNAPISFAADKRQVMNWSWQHHQLEIEIAEEHHTDHKIFQLDLKGIYQAKNLVTVLEACSVLHEKGWRTDEVVVRKALQHVQKATGLGGRWEIIKTNPLVVLDVAHNKDGIDQVLQQVEIVNPGKLFIVIGLVKDKEIDAIISILPTHADYYFSNANIPRAIPAEELSTIALKYGLRGNVVPDVNKAIESALSRAQPADMILVCGSVFLIGEVVH
jgi:dihydrofolate synthase/folylpolyglutamate synthase